MTENITVKCGGGGVGGGVIFLFFFLLRNVEAQIITMCSLVSLQNTQFSSSLKE